jgi:ATP-dependent protease HslVU (ClpYQ) peptidase subunit
MTAILGIQGNGWAVLAADSLTTYDDKPYVAKGVDKIVQVDEYLVAVAGDAIAGDILYHLWVPPKVVKTGNPDSFVMKKVLPSIKLILTNSGYDVPGQKKDEDNGWDAIIAFNGLIYQLTDDYGYMRDDRKLFAIGSGGALALGALAGMGAERAPNPPKAISSAKKAIKIASDYNIYCGGDVKVKTQVSK